MNAITRTSLAALLLFAAGQLCAQSGAQLETSILANFEVRESGPGGDDTAYPVGGSATGGE